MFNPTPYRPLERFSGLETSYSRGRPGYPAAAFAAILADLPANARIADVGCGTGIFTRALAERGFSVLGIDPNAAMLSEASRTYVTGAVQPNYSLGSGEATGLSSASIDLVVVAQAFHWIEAEKALREFHRVLVPGGRVALLWNEADEADPCSAEFWQAVRAAAAEPEVVREPHAAAGKALLSHPLFVHPSELEFANEQLLDREGLRNRAISISFVARSGPKANAYADAIEALFERWRDEQTVTLRYRTIVYVAQAKVGARDN